MPLDLGHDTPWLPPTLRLITEAGEVAAQLMRRSPDRAFEQVADPVLQAYTSLADSLPRADPRRTHGRQLLDPCFPGLPEGFRPLADDIQTDASVLQDGMGRFEKADKFICLVVQW